MNSSLTFELEARIGAAGFRTALWRLASEEGLPGWITSLPGKFILHLEGDEDRIKLFMSSLPSRLPKHCKIEAIRLAVREQYQEGRKEPCPRFRIIDQKDEEEFWQPPPADRAPCPDCLAEIASKESRRFAYPFASCKNCGPGLSILQQLPFERRKTTMSAFPLCQKCREESNSLDAGHLFRADTISCPTCGPQLFLAGPDGQQMINAEPLMAARAALAAGKVLAVRGTGGFRLAVDAFNRDALTLLRKRKRHSPLRPYAVMARDLNVIKAYCECPIEAETLLQSPAAPIVVLRLKPSRQFPKPLPADLIAPDGPTLGVMLPDSPLSLLLFEPHLHGDAIGPFDMLVMMRGDRAGGATPITNEVAFEKLGRIADLFLCHDREISVRCDDSVCAIRNGAPQVWRLGRGLAPVQVKLKRKLRRPVLALGSDFKCSIAMGARRSIAPSPHIGNLNSTEAAQSLLDFTGIMPSLMDAAPEVIAIDMNAEMHSSCEGVRLAAKWGLPVVKVQHHFAHALSCMAENGLESALALVFDGAGTGSDGTIWGAELLEVSLLGFRRLASFAPVPLPGAETAVSRPTRQLIGRFQAAGMTPSAAWLERLGLDETESGLWLNQCGRRMNAPLCHSAGRLFDVVSVMLGLAPDFISYDGQTAIRLEYAALRGDPSEAAPDRIARRYDFSFAEHGPLGLVDWAPMFRNFAEPPIIPAEDMPKHAIAFHCAMARAAAKMVQYGAEKSDCRDVLLSGGVFTNRLLCELVPDAIAMLGLNVFTHKILPPNDGGLAVGQALFAGMNP